jgi:hypothetical protein
MENMMEFDLQMIRRALQAAKAYGYISQIQRELELDGFEIKVVKQ